MTEKKFGVSPRSIEAQLPFMDKGTQERYRRNRARFDADQRSFELWAASGFSSATLLESE